MAIHSARPAIQPGHFRSESMANNLPRRPHPGHKGRPGEKTGHERLARTGSMGNRARDRCKPRLESLESVAFPRRVSRGLKGPSRPQLPKEPGGSGSRIMQEGIPGPRADHLPRPAVPARAHLPDKGRRGDRAAVGENGLLDFPGRACIINSPVAGANERPVAPGGLLYSTVVSDRPICRMPRAWNRRSWRR